MGINIHPHGSHSCYCPECNFTMVVETGVKCNTVVCPECGSRLRAVETGEYRNGMSQR